MSAMEQETQYKILRTLESQPETTQRELATDLGVSLGKVNYCLKRLVEKGWVEAQNFYHNPNKKVYAYMLTRQGIEKKTYMARQFLRWKMDEYDQLQREIDQLRQELGEEALREDSIGVVFDEAGSK